MKISIHFILVVSALFLSVFSWCQTKAEVNSNWQKLNFGTSEERVKSADFLHEYYSSENKDSVRIIGEKLFFYGIDNNEAAAIEDGKIILSEALIFDKKEIEAIVLLKSLLKKIENRNDTIKEAIISNLIAEAYVYMGDGRTALDWAKKSISLNEKSLDPNVRLKGKLLLADVYLLMNKRKEAIAILNKLVVVNSKLNNYKRLSYVHAFLGKIFLENVEIKKAAYHFTQSEKFARKINLTIPMANAINNLGIIDYENGNIDASKQKFFKSLKLRLKTGDQKTISESYFNIGDFYFYLNNLDEARKWYNQSANVASKNNLFKEEIDAYIALINISKTQTDYKEATLYYEQILEIQKKQTISVLKNDEEWAEINREIILSENINYSIRTEKWYAKWFKLEWGIILILVITIFVILKKTSSIDQEKPSEN